MPSRARCRDLRQKFSRADQRFRRHAAGIKAIAAEPAPLDKGDLGFDGRCDVGSDKARRTRTDDDDVAVEPRGLGPSRVNPARLYAFDELLRDEREYAEQRERHEQRRRQDAAQRFDLCDSVPAFT